MMAYKYLLVSDFDGTVANTFVKSPNGVNVDRAYEYAVRELFGGVGIKAYQEIGELQNRAPGEIVLNMLSQAGYSGSLNLNAEQCFDERNKTLSRLVPEGKGSPLEWRSSKDNFQNLNTITEMLVLLKLSYLMEEIGAECSDGTYWPVPCPGFVDFYEFLEELNKNDELDIQFAILSSGHDVFIQRTFELWGLDVPKITVTDDDMRGANYPKSMDRKVKPSSYLFDLIQSQWLNSFMRIDDSPRSIEQILYYRDRMIYFGDDQNKDRGLARNAGVLFGHFSPETCSSSVDIRGNIFFADWLYITMLLKMPVIVSRMHEGCSFVDIFTNL